MRRVSSAALVPSNRSTPESRSRAPGSGSDEDTAWFAPACWAILGKSDAGGVLAKITGWPESTCRYYVANDPRHRRQPKMDFVRSLFANDQYGELFFRAFMANCRARWWLEFQRNAEIGSRVLDLTKND